MAFEIDEDSTPTRTNQLLMLICEELRIIRFYLQNPDRKGLIIGGFTAEEIETRLERDVEKFREDLGL